MGLQPNNQHSGFAKNLGLLPRPRPSPHGRLETGPYHLGSRGGSGITHWPYLLFLPLVHFMCQHLRENEINKPITLHLSQNRENYISFFLYFWIFWIFLFQLGLSCFWNFCCHCNLIAIGTFAAIGAFVVINPFVSVGTFVAIGTKLPLGFLCKF